MVRTLVSNGRLMSLIIAVIIVSGLGALNTLPRSEDPRISARTAFILTPYPGASAERVESLVTEPLENKVREIEELMEIKSTSRAGMSVLTLKLKDVELLRPGHCGRCLHAALQWAAVDGCYW